MFLFMVGKFGRKPGGCRGQGGHYSHISHKSLKKKFNAEIAEARRGYAEKNLRFEDLKFQMKVRFFV